MRSFVFAFFFSLTLFSLNAQKENRVWLLSKDIKLAFNSDTPSISYEKNNLSFVNIQEGTVSVCDSIGQLLFYSDGEKIWDRNHALVKNSNDIGGNRSTVQGVVAVASDLKTGIYHVFGLEGAGTDDGSALYHSILDMRKNGGNGELIQIKRKIWENLTEKMIVIPHPCGGAWVVLHERDNSNFLAFHLENDHVSSNPVISKIGSIHSSYSGAMSYSKNGGTLCIVTSNSILEIFKFDPFSGLISKHINIYSHSKNPIDFITEFSPDGRYLFSIENGYSSSLKRTVFGAIVQHDISRKNRIDIKKSRKVIGFLNEPGLYKKGMKIGPDEKLYILNSGRNPSIYVLENPNHESDFQGYYIDLKNDLRSRCFPQDVVKGTKLEKLSLSDTTVCKDFAIDLSAEEVTVKWSDGNMDVKRTFREAGQYQVEITDKAGCVYQDTFVLNIDKDILALPDTTVCQTLEVDLSGKVSEVQWSDGQTGVLRTFTTPGTYSFEAKEASGCTIQDTFSLSRYPYVSDTLAITIGSGEVYNWQDSTYDMAGEYRRAYTDGNGCEGLHILHLEIRNEDKPTDLYIPTVFSPNGDSQNDQFRFYSKNENDYVVKKFYVFDHWGNRLYAKEGDLPLSQVKWDGLVNGSPAYVGLYAYYVVLEDREQNQVTYSGSIQVIR